MNCDEIRQLNDAWADGELDLVRNLEIEAHLKTCAACARVFENTRALKTAVSGGGLYYPAPPGLQRRVRSALRAEAGTRATPPAPRSVAWPWLRWAFPVAGAAFIALVFTTIILHNPAGAHLADEITAGHIRSLQAGHLTDVASTDQHTVKPWFDGRLDFAPPVADPAAQDFPLIGGRLDFMADRPVAALVYQRQKHVINLFIWPEPRGPAANETFTLRGYNLVHWHEAGMTFWAVSDLNTAELRDFAQAIKSSLASAPR